MILQIKTQGFPNLIRDLGVQSPLQGPFWGFDPTVIPTYQIGSDSINKNALGLPYPKANFIDDVAVNPGASAIPIQTPNLEAGIWAFQVHWAIGNGSANSTFLLYKVANVGGTVIRVTAICCVAPTGSSAAFQNGETNFVEEIQEGDTIFLENLTALANADFRTTLRWVKLSNSSVLPSP